MENLKNNLPFITIGLLVLGFARLVAFYDFFGINIVSYLETTEILQLQFGFFALSAIIIILFSLQLLDSVGKAIKKREEASSIPNPPENKDYKAPWFVKNSFRILLGFGTAIFVAKNYYDYHAIGIIVPLHVELMAVIGFLFLISLDLKHLDSAIDRLSKTDPKAITAYVITFLFLILTLAVVLMVRSDAYDILTKKTESEATFVLDSRTITSDSALVYIGKTRNYVFLYDKIKEQAEVIPIDKINDSYFRPGKANTLIPKQFQTEYYHRPK
jgi:hypothetical protein